MQKVHSDSDSESQSLTVGRIGWCLACFSAGTCLTFCTAIKSVPSHPLIIIPTLQAGLNDGAAGLNDGSVWLNDESAYAWLNDGSAWLNDGSEGLNLDH